jgi:hypothetical protein
MQYSCEYWGWAHQRPNNEFGQSRPMLRQLNCTQAYGDVVLGIVWAAALVKFRRSAPFARACQSHMLVDQPNQAPTKLQSTIYHTTPSFTNIYRIVSRSLIESSGWRQGARELNRAWSASPCGRART